MKPSRRLLIVPVLLSLALAQPLVALGSDDECSLFGEFDHFTVLTRWASIDEPEDLSVGTNASIVDDELCTAGVSRETFDSRIIPPATRQLQFGYHPFGPCGDEDCSGNPRCLNGVAVQLKLDGLGWDGAMVNMTCRGSYWTEWLTIPAGPEAAGALIVTVQRNPQGFSESTQYHTST